MLTVEAPGYLPLHGEWPATSEVTLPVTLVLDPQTPPPQLAPARIEAMRRADAMLLAGFVGDTQTGAPLAGVEVWAELAEVRAVTDGAGFFALSVPAPVGGTLAGGSLRFRLPGYRTQVRKDLELWAGGDWLMRIRLSPGEGSEFHESRAQRRRAGETPPPPPSDPPAPDLARGPKDDPPPPVRVPRTIRVLRNDGAGVDYVSLETYCKRVLPAEWVASWANFTGGSNSLMAGAVAIRTFGAGYVGNPLAATYDVCATTSCQVYSPALNNSAANTAVDQTSGFLMLPPGATRIGFKHTEYSAENNALGLACGDGFTGNSGGCIADPVCAGETRFGHGRGLCQWGSAKWATGLKFPGNGFPLNPTATNGQPRQNWSWILDHYYPALRLTQGTPLVVGDFVRVTGTSSLPVRECAGGGINGGGACPLLGTKATGATGLILAGPQQVVSDGLGHTWYRVQWLDGSGLIGWSPENWLERTAPPASVPPVLLPLPDRTVVEGQPLSFVASATAGATVETPITDFEEFASGSANGSVLFRAPTFSGSTSARLDATPDLSQVTGSFPPGVPGARALRVNWSWNASANPWLRLTTFGAANLPNPVIDLTRRMEFDLHTDRALRVALGVREAVVPAGTPIGANGGSSGAIEWAGVTHVVGGQPQATRLIPAGSWTRVSFNLPTEPVRDFNSGNGVLSTASGLAVLEHLAFVPADGAGAYNVFLDNVVVAAPNVLTYNLSNAPAGATIDPASGLFTWTPTEEQGPGVYAITVRVTDSQAPPLSDAKTFTVTVLESNQPPVLAVPPNPVVHQGGVVVFTNSASDADLPPNTLTFSLDPGAPVGAAIHPQTGVFTWATAGVVPGATNFFTVRVTDDGEPPLSAAHPFHVAVLARPAAEVAVAEGAVTLSWSAIPGTRYRVRFAESLTAPVWTDLAPEVLATGNTATWTGGTAGAGGYYRILVLD